MGQTQCCHAVSAPSDKIAPSSNHLHIKLAQLQEDPCENPNANPDHLTGRSLASKRLGDAQDGEYIKARPMLSRQVAERLQVLESIENECYRRLKGDRGIKQNNKFFKNTRTGVVYQGQWAKGKPHGYGKNYYPSGGYYEGIFIAGLPNVYGRFVNSNGHYYQGQVKFGRGNGQGVYIAGDIVFRGCFKDNVLHGEGEEKGGNYFFQGQYEYGSKKHGILKYGGNIYEGGFQEDVFEGQGVLSTEQGRYTGGFHRGLQHGYGQFHWKSGSIYRGHYQRGARQGDGQFYNGQSKSMCRGIWRRGVLQGEGVYKEPRGTNNKVVWRQGKIQALRT